MIIIFDPHHTFHTCSSCSRNRRADETERLRKGALLAQERKGEKKTTTPDDDGLQTELSPGEEPKNQVFCKDPHLFGAGK